MANVVHRNHPHCCGAADIEGMNRANFTPATFMAGLVQSIPSYANPHRSSDSYAGTGFINLVQAHACRTKPGLPEYGEYQRTPTQHKSVFRRMYQLQKYIEKHELGTLVIGEECGNPNYGGRHRLLPAIFIPHNKNLRAYAIKRKWIDPSPPVRTPQFDYITFT